jgi:hypothetical protein
MERRELFVSSISSWEIALLIRKGRLELTMPAEDWVARSEALPFLQFVACDNHIVLRSNRLPARCMRTPPIASSSPRPSAWAPPWFQRIGKFGTILMCRYA